ncbi:MAG: hypothetical protein H6713_15470 [Myxococcales bacterium]|nr:hypothetical protein [Myxococcales bacterium]
MSNEDWEQSLYRLGAYRTLRSRLIPLVDQTATWDSEAETAPADRGQARRPPRRELPVGGRRPRLRRGDPRVRHGLPQPVLRRRHEPDLLVALTGLRMPSILGDYSHICLDERGADAFRRFQKTLVALADRIDEANARRRWPCDLINPRYLESSVSI